MYRPLFRLGAVVATPGAVQAFQESGDDPYQYLKRHVTGDWGELCAEDRQANAYALRKGMRLLSVYKLSNGEKIWLISEADRSCSTFLLPEEY